MNLSSLVPVRLIGGSVSRSTLVGQDEAARTRVSHRHRHDHVHVRQEVPCDTEAEVVRHIHPKYQKRCDGEPPVREEKLEVDEAPARHPLRCVDRTFAVFADASLPDRLKVVFCKAKLLLVELGDVAKRLESLIVPASAEKILGRLLEGENEKSQCKARQRDCAKREEEVCKSSKHQQGSNNELPPPSTACRRHPAHMGDSG